jgi:hypothetical protein
VAPTRKRARGTARELGLAEVLRSLPLFEDLYLGIQAMNLQIVDGFLQDQEHALLREYMQAESTPIPSMMFVSALSQLWVFGIYELLRTWRQRVRGVLDFVYELRTVRPEDQRQFIERRQREVQKASQHALVSRWEDFARAAEDPEFVSRLEQGFDKSELVFRRIESLRISLAKHEIPRSEGALALAPGYARMDEASGSIRWEIVLRGNEVDTVSRREIAKACLGLAEDQSDRILPRAVQPKLKGIPRLSYAIKRVSVKLRDGTSFSRVWVAYDKLVVRVEGHLDVFPFDARNVVDVTYEAAT